MKLKRLLFAISLGLFSFTSVSTGSSTGIVETPKVVVADGMASHQIEKSCTQYIEFKYWSPTTYNLWDMPTVDEPLFSDPGDTFEKSKGDNGGDNAGTLTIQATHLDRKGYFRPSNTFAYSSFAVEGEVNFQFQFHRVNSFDGMRNYEVVDCKDNYLDGFPIGSKMGHGALVILKRHAGDSSWTKVDMGGIANSDLPDGRIIPFKPSGQDILQGTYFRFVSAYQYRYQVNENVVTRDRQFYDVMQRITVYVGYGNTQIKFASSTTPKQTHAMAMTNFEETGLKEGNLNLGLSTIANIPPLGKTTVGEFSIEGEAIKSNEDSLGVENNVPVYVYNGVTNNVDIKLRNFSSTVDSALKETSDSNTFAILTEHAKVGKKIPSTEVIGGVKNGSFLLQGLSKTDKGDDYWFDVDAKYGIGTANSSITLPITKVGQYSCFRALFIKPFAYGDKTVFETAVSYFKVAVVDLTKPRYAGASNASAGEDAEVSALAAASTLSDGSTVFSSFSVSKTVSSYVVEYAFNGQSYKTMSGSSATFTEIGKYRFRVTNAFGEVAYTTIYLLALGEDSGRSQFFPKYGGLLDESMRVYDPNSYYPVYGKGVPFYVEAHNNWPGLFGRIKRVNPNGTAEIIQEFENLHTPLSGTFDDIGQYRVEIAVGDKNASGDHLEYAINFLVDEEAKYTPTINYDLLHSGIQGTSYSPKVYIVDEQSQGAGRYRFVFPYTQNGYIQAWDFAMELEALHYVDNGDGTYQYPGANGAKFNNLFDLFDAIKETAKGRIKATMFDVSRIHEDYVSPNIEDISSTPLEEDIYVVSDESIYASLVKEPIYVNGYAFVQIREYESESVKMVSPSGEVIDIPYGIVVDELLLETGVYTVIEENWCGVSTYEVLYCAPNDIKTTIDFDYYDAHGDIASKMQTLSSHEDLTGLAFHFSKVDDPFDPYGRVEIRHGNELLGFLYEELEGKLIDVAGDYEIHVYNRLGHSYSFNLHIVGDKHSSDWQPHFDATSPLTYVRGGVHL